MTEETRIPVDSAAANRNEPGSRSTRCLEPGRAVLNDKRRLSGDLQSGECAGENSRRWFSGSDIVCGDHDREEALQGETFEKSRSRQSGSACRECELFSTIESSPFLVETLRGS